MKVDYYGLRPGIRAEPDLEHELIREDALTRAKCGQTVLVKLWLRTDGPADLAKLEEAIRLAVAPLGLR